MNLGRIEGLPAVKAVGIRLLGVHQAIYERSGGRVGHRLFGTRNLLLRTVGAKTGARRTTALSYVRDGADYVVVASFGGSPRAPGWYHNLTAQPDVEIQVGTQVVPVRARTVPSDDSARSRMWRLADDANDGRYTNYQKLTSREIPVVALAPR